MIGEQLDFIGIGAPRCGTTWVSSMLRTHPNVFIPSNEKELHFFDGWNYELGLDWYHSFFKQADAQQRTGEFTPRYLGEDKAIPLIDSYKPDIKLLVCLRNPIERAISHYKYVRSFENISSNFRKALDDSRFEFKERGLYGKQISKWFKIFDRNQFYFIFFEDLKNNPTLVMNNLFNFLGVDNLEESEIDNSKINASHGVTSQKLYKTIRIIKKRIRKNKFFYSWINTLKINHVGGWLNKINKTSKIKEINLKIDTIEYLEDFYKNDIVILAELLDKNLDHWIMRD